MVKKSYMYLKWCLGAGIYAAIASLVAETATKSLGYAAIASLMGIGSDNVAGVCSDRFAGWGI